jgi:antitoxin component of RelBE/YafQ-DinJ toxin-antitoxin module
MDNKEFKTVQIDASTKERLLQLSEKTGISQSELISALVTYASQNNITITKGQTTIHVSGDLQDSSGKVHKAKDVKE